MGRLIGIGVITAVVGIAGYFQLGTSTRPTDNVIDRPSSSWEQTPNHKGLYLTTPTLFDESNLVSRGEHAAAFENPSVNGVFIRLAWNQLNPQPGEFDWRLLDAEVASALAHNKKISLGVATGALAPDWIAARGAVRGNFETVGSRSKNTCTQSPVYLPWDPVYQQAFRDLHNALAAHLKEIGAYDDVRIIKLTGMNQDNLQYRLPNTPDKATGSGNECLAKNATEWRRLGYDPQKVRTASLALATIAHEAFPEKVLSLAPIEANAFPALDANGNTAPREDSYGLVLQIIRDGQQAFPGQYATQDQSLTLWQDEPLADDSLEIGTFIGWQTRAPRQGADCARSKDAPHTPCTPAEYTELLMRGINWGGSFVEVWPEDIISYSEAFREPCQAITGTSCSNRTR